MLEINQLKVQLPIFSISLNHAVFDRGLHIIIGPNGAGKTALLHGLIGFSEKIKSRSISVDGYMLNDTSEVMSFIPQDNPRFGISVRDYIHMTSKKKHSESAEYFGASEVLEQSITTLSGGEFKRVICAQVRNENKPIIIADEIEAHLDINHKYMIMDWLKEEAKEKTVIASIHDLNLAMTYADTLTVMSEGQFLATTAPIDTVDSHLLARAFKSDIHLLQIDNQTVVIRK